MIHYDYIEWIFYKEKVFSSEKIKKMEDHLYICDNCMNTFLSLIDGAEVDRAKESISLEFTNSVMNNIQKVKYKPKARIEKSNVKPREIFGYYVAVASVAIILTFGGFYSGLVDLAPQVAKITSTKNNLNKTNIVFNVSEKIVNKTSNFINNFEVSNRKEELK